MVKEQKTRKKAKIEKEFEETQKVRELGELYITKKIETLEKNINLKKELIVKDIIKFQEESVEENRRINPIIINNRFFKPITTITSQEPIYTAEKLGVVFDYYCYIVSEINARVGLYPTSLTSFCKLAGITQATLRSYRNSQDYSMRIVVEKIYDQISEENLTLSQLDYTKERTTLFKLKSQNELLEKQQPNVSIKIIDAPDMKQIEDRIEKYRELTNKKSKRV